MPPMRCLGIDWGERRWGLAYGDELAVALPLPAITEKDPAARWAALAGDARASHCESSGFRQN